MDPTRRSLIATLLAAPLAARSAPAVSQAPAVLEPTPPCDDGDEPTPTQAEGPFYTPRTPRRRDLASDDPTGTPLILAGFVLDTACRPIPGAIVDLWHADSSGAYDNDGYRFRGHQFTDEAGRWWFETIEPGLYPGRTRHYHVKVARPDGPVLTTQLYFPNEPQNARDFLFDPRLLLRISRDGGSRAGRYDFVMA